MTLSENFTIQPRNLEEICNVALSGGGNYCDLYFEDTAIGSLTLRDSSVSAGGLHIDYGCGIRVLDGEKTGYAYCESTDMASLLAAAKAAAAIASGKPAAFRAAPCGPAEAGRHYEIRRNWFECSATAFVPGLEKLDRLIRAKDSRVDKVIANLSYSISKVLMYNSFGEAAEDIRPLATLRVTAVFTSNGRVETRSVSESRRMGAEFFTDALIEQVAADAVKGVDQLFEARRPAGGQMAVVMGAGASGILLHEAMGHAFEADFNRKGQSVFSDRMGQQVCPKGINIVDDGTLPDFRGSINYDDEGVPGQKTYMVTDGVLTSYLHDRISAGFYGVAPTGNGRREGFRFHPLPRMRSTYMENGSGGTLEDLIHEAGNGIYVDEFSNGEVKIGEGDFTFFVKSGYLIENGRRTMPVKDINIIGNGPEALGRIRGVASDLIVDGGGWTCSKGQDVAVSCGMPSLLIDNLTVGGLGE